MNFHIFFSTGIYHSLVSYAKIIISLYLREKWGKKKTATSFGYGPFLFYENRFT